jgi:protease I
MEMTMKLDGKKIAILIAPRGTEEPEFAQPKSAVEQAGGTVTVISLEAGEAQTVNNDLDPGTTFPIDAAISDVSASDFDGLVIPGGCVGADKLRSSDAVIAFVRAFFTAGKPVAAICHAPWTLIEADQVRGRTLTSYPTLETDIRNAGGHWVDQDVVVDQGLVTSRTPDDLPAFCAKLVEEFCEGRHAAQAENA